MSQGVPSTPPGNPALVKPAVGRRISEVPSSPPEAYVQGCPHKPRRAGIFFDGTNNNLWQDGGEGCATNVGRLYTFYKREEGAEIRDKLYVIGVGTDQEPTSLHPDRLVYRDRPRGN